MKKISKTRFTSNGYISRVELKNEAKKIVSEKLSILWKGLALLFILDLLTNILIQYSNLDSVSTSIVNIGFNLLFVPLNVGVIYYNICVVRGKEFKVSDIFRYYGYSMFKIYLIQILMCLIIGVGLFLFIIPGLVFAFMYNFSLYWYVDHDDEDALTILGYSRNLIKGYKWDYFVFILSFLGWALLCLFIIPVIFVYPYFMVSNILYYDELKAIKECE